jgi:N-acetylmuramoyl-L-alanine amidase
VFKTAAVIFSVTIFLAGCATAPRRAPGETPPPPGGKTGAFPIPSAKTNLPPAAPVTAWTSLNRWAAERRIGAPHRLSDLPVTTYAIGSTNGTLVLEIGSLTATWRGVEIYLGFEPQFIDDQVFVHGLDLQKNLEPLLCAPLPASGTDCVLVLDPGHGGVQRGARSVRSGRFEKEFTLDWARRLASLLATNGWKVFLTRTNDTDVSLSNRVAFAEAHHADLFISLHFNSDAPDEKESGLETYCLTPAGMPSTFTRGYTDIWAQVFPNNAFDARNLQWAVCLQRALLHATSLEDRGVRRARFIGVLRGQRRPAVLIEGGYLSNPREAKLIETPEFRQKLAEAVAAALRQNEEGNKTSIAD